MPPPTTSMDLKLNSQNSDIPELMEPVSNDSEDSGISDTEVVEIPLTEDHDYQEFLPTTLNPSPSTSTSSKHYQHYKSILPPPPLRPAHFSCNPAGILIQPNLLSTVTVKRLIYLMKMVVKMVLF